jgi:O-antigen/teichoic acid export membrane protein
MAHVIQEAGTPASQPVRVKGRVGQWMRTKLGRVAGTDSKAAGDVIRHTMVLAAGSAVARVVGVASIPVITRLYTPEQYGLFALFLSATALLMPLASLRYSAALPLPRRHGTAVALLLVCLACLCMFLGLMAILFGLFSTNLFDLFSAGPLAPLWPVLVLSVGTAGLFEILTNWSVRRRRFRLMAQVDVTQSALGGLLKIGLGYLTLQRLGLVVGHIAAQVVACTMLARATWIEAARQVRRTCIRTLKMVAYRYADFPKFRLPSQMLMSFSQQAPLLFVTAMYGTATGGQLGLALVALALPLTLIGQTTGQAYYGEIARIGRADPARIRSLTRHVAIRLFLIGLVPTLVLGFAGARLFPLVFGTGWGEAGVYASILAIYLLAQFVANPLAHALSVFDKQRVFLGLNVVRAMMTVGAFTVAYLLELSSFEAIAAYSVVLSLHYVATSLSIFAVIRSAMAGRP